MAYEPQKLSFLELYTIRSKGLKLSKDIIERYLKKLVDKTITVEEMLSLSVIDNAKAEVTSKAKTLAGKGETGLARLGVNLQGRWIDEVANRQALEHLMDLETPSTSSTFKNIQRVEGAALDFYQNHGSLLGEDAHYPYLDPKYNVNHAHTKGMVKSEFFKNKKYQWKIVEFIEGEQKERFVNKGSQPRRKNAFKEIPHPRIIVPLLQQALRPDKMPNDAHRLAILFHILVPYRSGEVASLSLEDVNLKSGKISEFTRGNKTRAGLHLPPIALAILQEAAALAIEEGRQLIFNPLPQSEIEKEYKKGTSFGQTRTPEQRITSKYVAALTSTFNASGIKEELALYSEMMGRRIKGVSDLRKILPTLLVYQLALEKKDFTAITKAMGHSDSSKLFALLPKISQSYLGIVSDPNRPDAVRDALVILQDMLGEHLHSPDGTPTPVKYANNIPGSFGVLIDRLTNPKNPEYIERIERTKFKVLDFSDVNDQEAPNRKIPTTDDAVQRAAPSAPPETANKEIQTVARLHIAANELDIAALEKATLEQVLSNIKLQAKVNKALVDTAPEAGAEAARVLRVAQEKRGQRQDTFAKVAELQAQLDDFKNRGITPPPDLVADRDALNQYLEATDPDPPPKPVKIPVGVEDEIIRMRFAAQEILGLERFDPVNQATQGLFEAAAVDSPEGQKLKEQLRNFIQKYDAIAEGDPKALKGEQLLEQGYHRMRVEAINGLEMRDPARAAKVQESFFKKYNVNFRNVARTAGIGLVVLLGYMTIDALHNDLLADERTYKKKRPYLSPMQRRDWENYIGSKRALALAAGAGEIVNYTFKPLSDWILDYRRGQSEEVARSSPEFLRWKQTEGKRVEEDISKLLGERKEKRSRYMEGVREAARTDPNVNPLSLRETGQALAEDRRIEQEMRGAAEKSVLEDVDVTADIDPLEEAAQPPPSLDSKGLMSRDIAQRRFYGPHYDEFQELGLEKFQKKQLKRDWRAEQKSVEQMDKLMRQYTGAVN